MQLFSFLLIYPLIWFVSRLPFKLLYIASDILYFILYHLISYRKKTVMYNLKLVFPKKSNKERKNIAKLFYSHLCDIILESLKSINIKIDDMKDRFKFTNIEVVKDLERRNKSINMMLAHYNSWEWGFILQEYTSHKTIGIYKKLNNKYFDRLVKRSRARYNTFLVTTKEAIAVLTQNKENGLLTINGFAADQSPKLNKAFHWNNFLGIKVPVHTGAEMLAKKLDIPVVFFSVNKIKRGFYEATFKTITETPNDFKDYEITDKFLKLVENQIKQAPQYYLWTHKRWKYADN